MEVNRNKYLFSIYGQEYEVYPADAVIISGSQFEDDRACVAYRKTINNVTINKGEVKPSRDGFVRVPSDVVYSMLVDVWSNQDNWVDRFYFIVRDTLFNIDNSFVFNILDCEFDFDLGTVDIQFVDRDEYFAIDEHGDDVVDLFDVRKYGYPYSERKRVSIQVRPVAIEDLEFYCCYDSENWLYDLNPTYTGLVTIEGNLIYVLAICTSKIKPPFSNGWQFDELEERWFCNPEDVNNGFIYGWNVIAAKVPVGANIETFVVNHAASQGINEVVKWINYRIPLNPNRYVIIFGYENLASVPVPMDNALTFEQAMDAVAARLGYTVDAQYQNMFGTPHQLVMQKSDFKRYEVSNNATKFETTFNKMMNTLKTVTNLLWWVEDNVLYLRPAWNTYQYFPMNDKTKLEVRNKFNINYENIPYKESWVFMEQGTTRFDVDTCIYNLSLKSVSDGNDKSYTADDCTVDLYHILYNIDDISDAGMVLLACDQDADGNYNVRYGESGIGSYPNGEFSTRSIQERNFRWNRPIKKYFYDEDGETPVFAKTTLSLIELKFKTPFLLKDDERFNPQNKVLVTVYSEKQGQNIEVEGYIKSYEYNTRTRRIDATVRTQVIT